MSKARGKFITFEGPEGSGKTTQIELLKQYLSKKGNSVIITREPGGERIAEKIRRILLSPLSSIEPVTELFLYAASRVQHVEKVIRPAIQKGKVVLCDRFADATMAYQSYGRKIPKEVVKTINKLATSGLKPDLTILLDIDPGTGLKRARNVKGFYKGSADRIERESLAFHCRVRQGYLKLAKAEPKRIKVVKVREKIKDTQARIREIVADAL
ncbi:MAG: dTMP kinase [Candidatus Omnitrophica bacterium]|nr:dTMP kinase [Candidatus Omnitrophota bacterium]